MDPPVQSVITLRCASCRGRVWAQGTAGVVEEPRWKRPLQEGVIISFVNKARGQNNLKADWCSLEKGLPSKSAAA